MPYTDKFGTFFARRLPGVSFGGPRLILNTEDGSPATRLDANVYPVGSALSAKHEHPEGIVLSGEDALRLGIETEA